MRKEFTFAGLAVGGILLIALSAGAGANAHTAAPVQDKATLDFTNRIGLDCPGLIEAGETLRAQGGPRETRTPEQLATGLIAQLTGLTATDVGSRLTVSVPASNQRDYTLTNIAGKRTIHISASDQGNGWAIDTVAKCAS